LSLFYSWENILLALEDIAFVTRLALFPSVEDGMLPLYYAAALGATILPVNVMLREELNTFCKHALEL
jgi:hypothetical protein